MNTEVLSNAENISPCHRLLVETIHRNQRQTLTSSHRNNILHWVSLRLYNLLCNCKLLVFSFHEGLDPRLQNNLEISILPASYGVINLFWFYMSTNGVNGHNCKILLFLLVWNVDVCVGASAKANTFAMLKNNENLSDFKMALCEWTLKCC